MQIRVNASSVRNSGAALGAPLKLTRKGVSQMRIGISVLNVLGWFAVSSAIAGLGVAAWISSRPGLQRLLNDVEKPAVKAERAQQPITARQVLTSSVAFALGILIGLLLS